MLEFILPFLSGFAAAKAFDGFKLLWRARKRQKIFPQSVETIGNFVDALKLLDQNYELKQPDNLKLIFAVDHRYKHVVLHLVMPTIH